jgi:hypothetical protein
VPTGRPTDAAFFLNDDQRSVEAGMIGKNSLSERAGVAEDCGLAKGAPPKPCYVGL